MNDIKKIIWLFVNESSGAPPDGSSLQEEKKTNYSDKCERFAIYIHQIAVII